MFLQLPKDQTFIFYLRKVFSGPKINLWWPGLQIKETYRKEWCVFQGCSLLTFDISELPVFLLLNISYTVADIFLIFYIWIHIDNMH